MSKLGQLELNDLKNVVKLSNKLSNEQIGKILNELKEDPAFVSDIDKSLSDTLLKFNKLYGDESLSKVKFVIDQYGKFSNDKHDGGSDKKKSTSTSEWLPGIIAAGIATTPAIASAFRGGPQQPQVLIVDRKKAQELFQHIQQQIQDAAMRQYFLQFLQFIGQQPVVAPNVVELVGMVRQDPTVVGALYGDGSVMPMNPMQMQPGAMTMQPGAMAMQPTLHANDMSAMPSGDTMALLQRYGYMAQRPVYPAGFQMGGGVSDDYKVELDSDEEGLNMLPILGESFNALNNFPTFDISTGQYGGGANKDAVPTIYLSGDAEGLLGVPTFLDMFSVPTQFNLSGGNLELDSPLQDIEMSGSAREKSETSDDDDLAELARQIATEKSEDEPRDGPNDANSEGSLMTDQLDTLSDSE